MMCGFGMLSGILCGLFAVLGIAWMAFSIRFFVKGAQYFQSKLDESQASKDHGAELLAKLDQLVDVLKVK